MFVRPINHVIKARARVAGKLVPVTVTHSVHKPEGVFNRVKTAAGKRMTVPHSELVFKGDNKED